MDDSGEWGIAPAYDTCFSHNAAAGKWTRQHQMLVAGKAWNIEAADLIALAHQFDVRQPGALLKQIADAVARWPEFARTAGVPPEKTARIASYHSGWVT